MRSGSLATTGVIAVLAASLLGLIINDVADHRRIAAHAMAMTGGDPAAGRLALARRPCGQCHQIPGVAGAQGRVGPPLAAWDGRVFIDGRLQNSPDNLVAWIRDPHAIDPQAAMLNMGIGEREARDMAAYLYTLKP